jgi:hypothetical protein
MQMEIPRGSLAVSAHVQFNSPEGGGHRYPILTRKVTLTREYGLTYERATELTRAWRTANDRESLSARFTVDL